MSGVRGSKSSKNSIRFVANFAYRYDIMNSKIPTSTGTNDVQHTNEKKHLRVPLLSRHIYVEDTIVQVPVHATTYIPGIWHTRYTVASDTHCDTFATVPVRFVIPSLFGYC